MKRVLLSGVALAALVGSATAADIPRRVQTATPATVVAPVYNWTGMYVGLFGGWGWGDASFSGIGGGDINVDGGLFGGTIGYNLQSGALVYGLEADIAWSGIDGGRTCGVIACSVENNWLSTVRGRVGVAIDRFMPYVTGGVAFGDIDANAAGFPGASDTRVGWALGGGVEFAMASPWTIKLEYLYVDLGDFDCGTACGAAVGPDNVSFNAHTLKVGANYRF